MRDPSERRDDLRSRSAAWIGVIVLALTGACGFGFWWLLERRQRALDRATIDQISSAAFGCVASLRGDAPEGWSLIRALEHMSHMEHQTRDRSDPVHRAARERFAGLAADAATGCEHLGRRMSRARDEAPHLYFAVPAVLAQPPDMEDPEPWFRRLLPDTRPEAAELARQITVMAWTINQRRQELRLMPTDLPVRGRGPEALAKVIPLARLPRDREHHSTEVWPTPDAIVVLRRGSLPRVRCETRFVSRASCLNELVQRVSWEGEPEPPRELERPRRVSYWSTFTPTFDGALWAVGVDRGGSGVIGRYPRGERRARVAPIDAAVDARTNIVTTAGGVAVFPTDGSAWLCEGDASMAFERVETTPPPLILHTARGGVARGIEDAALGRLSITGSADHGFTSRSSSADGRPDVLVRMIDSRTRVREITDLRALRSGRSVALLRRSAAPDAIAITSDFGRTWLAAR